jgi:L-lactate dehydrogenase (cytochrome)
VGGAEGIDYAIRILMEEVIQNMGALGLNSLSELTRDRLFPLGPRAIFSGWNAANS